MDASIISGRAAPDTVPIPGEPGRTPFSTDALYAEAARILSQSEAVNILSCSANKEDHQFLEQALGNYARWPKTFQPVLYKCFDLAPALKLLGRVKFAIVLCDQEIPGTWQQLLAQIQVLPNTQFLIVTSRLADEQLWAEALNIGAYDVLAKPFDVDEVIRVVISAWNQWTYQQNFFLQSRNVMRA
jgi:CheY-like chemotaxis protein